MGLSVGPTLKSVQLPASLKTLENYPLLLNTELEEIKISADNAYFKVVDNVIFTKDGKSIVAYPDSKKDEVFNVPEGVEYFNTPLDNKYIKTLNLPASLKELDTKATNYFNVLEAINVAAENSEFYSIDGVLFSKEGKLLTYPRAKADETYIAPEGTKIVGNDAFSRTQYLKKIEMPTSIEKFEGRLGYMKADTLVMHSTVPPTATDEGMDIVGKLVLEVPDGCIESYKNAEGWNKFAFIVDSSNKNTVTFEAGVLKYELTTIDADNPQVRVLGFSKEPDKAKNLVIPASVSYNGVRHAITEIAPYAFYESDKILQATIAVSIVKIGKGAFSDSNITALSFGTASKLEIIEEKAFYYCSQLGTFTLPTNLKEIGKDAFFSSGNGMTLMTLKIPANVERIGIDAFGYCRSITQFTTDSKNEYFVTKDGILYTADMTELVAYPENKSDDTYWLPETVKTINCVISDNLYRFVVNSMVPPTCTTNRNSFTTLYVPEGAKSAYENDEKWKNFYEIIEISNSTNAIADGGYYLYNKEADAFLARGCDWGVQATMERTSVPLQFMRDQLEERYTMRYFDAANNLSLGVDWENELPYTDKTKYDAIYWECQRTEDGRILLYNIDTDSWLKSEGLHNGCTTTRDKDEATAFMLVNEQEVLDSIYNARYNVASEITSTMHAVDKTDMLLNPTMSTNIGNWNPEFKSQYINGSITSRNGLTETYHMYGQISQTVTGLEPGIYRFSLEGFYRGGTNAVCAWYSEHGVPLQSAYLFANEDEYPFATWASGRESDVNPNSMEEAYVLIARGKYKSSVFTRVGEDGVLTVGLVEPHSVPDGWMIWRNATLTYYEEDPTGIKNIESDGSTDIYSVSGVKLNAMQKGINIVKDKNGKWVKIKK